MPQLFRQVYVISDLHLGGVYGDPAKSGDRGFRLCTHTAELVAFVDALASKPVAGPAIELVINGDMVDFLAERESDPPYWTPFTPDQQLATRKLEAILGRDQAFVNALRRFLAAGHRLVLTLGNHDLELALPLVRRRLISLLDARGRDFEFLYDGEGYLVGDALIEHGNRYDRWNVVDNDALRRFRSLLSRRQPVPDKYAFDPPAGSKMVATVINPVKGDYQFVDLLKPEHEAVIPLLLALEPGYRRFILKAIPLDLESRKHKMAAPAMPGMGGDISAQDDPMGGPIGADISAAAVMEPAATESESELERILGKAMGDHAEGFLEEMRHLEGEIGSDISASETIDRTLGFVKLLFGKQKEAMEKRLPSLLKALRALHGDRSFDPAVETDRDTLQAAEALASGGIHYVVFGHTHMAKRVPLEGGGLYFNSGTWADVMQFPEEIISGSETDALAKTRDFVAKMATGDYTDWTLFRPTYVRLDFDTPDTVGKAELCSSVSPETV